MERDTMCATCYRYTHINTERGEGVVFCDDSCKRNYSRPLDNVHHCVAGKGWYNRPDSFDLRAALRDMFELPKE